MWAMQLPLVGKVKRPLPWLIGLLAVGVLGASAIAFTVFRTQNTPLNIAELTVPVEAQAVTLRITASGTV